MRTETPENHPYINAKIWQFWIGHSTAYTRVLIFPELLRNHVVSRKLLKLPNAGHGFERLLPVHL